MRTFKLTIAASLLFTTVAFGQPAPMPPEIVLRVTPAEIDLISEGLQTQPFGKVVPLINKLREQIMAQQPKPVPPVEPKKDEVEK